jgi:hypothetical protein
MGASNIVAARMVRNQDASSKLQVPAPAIVELTRFPLVAIFSGMARQARI